MQTSSSDHCCTPRRLTLAGFSAKTWIAAVVLGAAIAASFVWRPLEAFRVSVFLYFKAIGWAMVFGFLLGGLLERYVPREYISRVLAEGKKRSVIYSVFLGLIMSACSHGIIALAVELHKKGASTPVVVSFLLASPWANLPITLLLFGFFGLKALYIICGALLVAMLTGFLFQALERRGWVERNAHAMAVSANFSILKDVAQRARAYRFSWKGVGDDIKSVARGSVALADMMLAWILLGIGLSALAAAFLPAGIFHHYMSASLKGLMTTLGLATVLEVCSEGTSPLAFEIYRQTGAFGNAFVFLMAGVVTDYTEIAILWANIGRRTALWLPVITVPQVVFLGYLANHLFK